MSPRYGRPERDASRWWDRLWEPFWVLPAVVALLSVALGVVLPQLDGAPLELDTGCLRGRT